ncbi:MAG: hypothetical protein KDB26_10735 [Microthrixaceae bacterium]|nr:hypothetical protein [Microthrixaceae bacterium]
MTSKVGGIERDRDDVPSSGRDVPVASRAYVSLESLVGLDHPHLAFVDGGEVRHCSPSDHPRMAQATHAATINIADATMRMSQGDCL